MAEDSLEVRDEVDFHPCATPRGMAWYDLETLTADQQEKLNELKRNTVKEDEKYLAKHPEVRGLVAILTKAVLAQRPRSGLHEFATKFFSRPRSDIEDELKEYLQTREGHVCENDSATKVVPEPEEDKEEKLLPPEEIDLPILSDVDVSKTSEMAYQHMQEIVNESLKRLGIFDEIDDFPDNENQAFEGKVSDLDEELDYMEREIMKNEIENIVADIVENAVAVLEESQAIEGTESSVYSKMFENDDEEEFSCPEIITFDNVY